MLVISAFSDISSSFEVMLNSLLFVLRLLKRDIRGLKLLCSKGNNPGLEKYKVKNRFLYLNQMGDRSSKELTEMEGSFENEFQSRYVNVPNINIISNQKKNESFGIRKIYTTTKKELRLKKFKNHKDKLSVSNEI